MHGKKRRCVVRYYIKQDTGYTIYDTKYYESITKTSENLYLSIQWVMTLIKLGKPFKIDNERLLTIDYDD